MKSKPNFAINEPVGDMRLADDLEINAPNVNASEESASSIRKRFGSAGWCLIAVGVVALIGTFLPHGMVYEEGVVTLSSEFETVGPANSQFSSTSEVAARKLAMQPTNLVPLVSPTSFPTDHPTFFPTQLPTTSNQIPSASPTAFPTNHPTFSPTRLPTTAAPTSPPSTTAPTNSPIQTPTDAPSSSPTSSPSISPTKEPTRACEFDVCGCDQEPSELVDIVFIADGSGSLGSTNYFLMRSAISSFVSQLQPPVNQTSGARVSYVEFTATAQVVIKLSESATASEFVTQILQLSFTPGFTNHTAGFEAVDFMLDEPAEALRPGSQLILVMLTDGNPCFGGCGGGCCPNSIADGNGTEVLRRIRGKRDLTFYFFPLEPVPSAGTASTDLFDGALTGENALSEDEFVRFDALNFAELETAFLSDNFTFPPGPCVDI